MTAENPEDYEPPVREEDVRAALQEVERQASNHGANYASGMREARRIVETRLIGGGSSE
jgi:hypothetical protein